MSVFQKCLVPVVMSLIWLTLCRSFDRGHISCPSSEQITLLTLWRVYLSFGLKKLLVPSTKFQPLFSGQQNQSLPIGSVLTTDVLVRSSICWADRRIVTHVASSSRYDSRVYDPG
ncbi:hypothetical protein LIER_39565 [Lithospermum erythrorhizon]|uniref:Secreted protein n=1 Tax=Lithospermum erythrorhizon TaxID=34254 RepID=A0AAV3QGS4_LITER